MKAYELDLGILLEGRSEPIVAKVDQRDFSAWEAQPEAENERAWVHTRFRFLAWHAARRAKQIDTEVTWAKFNEELCVQVSDLAAGEEELEDEQEPDPSTQG